jgi:hypothetical protein
VIRIGQNAVIARVLDVMHDVIVVESARHENMLRRLSWEEDAARLQAAASLKVC